MLQPEQVGILSRLILDSIRAHPVRPVESQEKLGEQMDAWEKDLRASVNGQVGMPLYNDIVEEDARLLEYLISYYAEGQ